MAFQPNDDLHGHWLTNRRSAPLLAAGFAALAWTGAPRRRDAIWLSGGLLIGVAIALIAVTAKIGPPGTYDDYSQAQSWGVTVAALLTGAVFTIGASRAHGATAPAGSPQPA